MFPLSFFGRFHMSFSHGDNLDKKLMKDFCIDEKNSRLIGFRVEGLMDKNNRKKSTPIHIALLVVKNSEWKDDSTFGEYFEKKNKIPVKVIPTKMSLNSFFNKYLESVGGDIVMDGLQEKYLEQINYQD